MNDIAAQLGADTTLRIEIGVGNSSIYISKAVLSNVSPGLSRLVDTAEPAVEEKHDYNLALAKDNYEAWQALFYWITKKRLPDAVEAELVSMWALGEKYGIIEFQDEAMMSLLLFCNAYSFDHDTIESAFTLTRPGSKLRRLMAEELIRKLKTMTAHSRALDLPNVNHLEMTYGNGFTGLMTELLNAQRRYSQSGNGFWERFAERENHRFGRWKQFMVGNGMSVRGRAAKQEREEDLGDSEYSSEESG